MATSDTVSVTSKVLEILEGNPSLPYSTIGGVVGVTRERVRQIARKNGYPSRVGITKSKKICQICGETFYTKNIYCSADCGYKARRKRIKLHCQQCGNTIERTPGNMRNKNRNYFCNRACYGKWQLNNNITAAKNREPSMGDFKLEASSKESGSKSEIFLKGKIPTSQILKIYNILLRLSESELVKINNNGVGDFKELGRAIRRKAGRQDTDIINAISAIIDIKEHSLLFVMRLTD